MSDQPQKSQFEQKRTHRFIKMEHDDDDSSTCSDASEFKSTAFISDEVLLVSLYESVEKHTRNDGSQVPHVFLGGLQANSMSPLLTLIHNVEGSVAIIAVPRNRVQDQTEIVMEL